MPQALINLIKKHEGLKLKPYYDTAVPPRLTIGYGRNLEDRGITGLEAEYLLENDIAKVLRELRLNLPCWEHLSDVRQVVLADMCFNLGLNGLLKFKRMIRALEDKHYIDAAKEMLDSVWANQVGRRANELAFMMREDKYQ